MIGIRNKSNCGKKAVQLNYNKGVKSGIEWLKNKHEYKEIEKLRSVTDEITLYVCRRSKTTSFQFFKASVQSLLNISFATIREIITHKIGNIAISNLI
jgi:hypothetical protein